MPIYEEDDDDDGESWRGSASQDDSSDENPDPRDLAREVAPVQCVHCHKWIHEDAHMCPRCHQWQTDENHPEPKAKWYVWTVIYCVLVIVVSWILLRHWW